MSGKSGTAREMAQSAGIAKYMIPGLDGETRYLHLDYTVCHATRAQDYPL